MNTAPAEIVNQRMPVLMTLIRDRPVLTIAEAAVLSTLSVQSIYRAVHSRRLATCAPGRILREDLKLFLRHERDLRART